MQKKTVEKQAAVRNSILRVAFAAIAILSEIIWLFVLIIRLNEYYVWISAVTGILALGLVLTLYGQHKTASMKMPWIMLILTFPILGVFLYLLVGISGATKRMRKRYEAIDQKLLPKLPANLQEMENLKQKDISLANLADYITKYAKYPIYGNSDVEFFDTAKKGLEAQKEELKKAKEFIFMEYHAIEDAESWHGI